jgi:hypothetical protein
MNTVLDNLRMEATRLRHILEELLAHSSIKRWHDPNTSEFGYMGGHFRWEPLDDEGRQAQAKSLEEYRRFYSVVSTLLREQPEDTLGTLEETNTTILELIQQQTPLYTADPNSHFDGALKAIDSQIGLLDRLHGHGDRKPVFVPDTNALIFNPAIEEWRFDGVAQFTILLTPPVLAELDSLKVNHRVEAVRDKSEKVIRQLKEYRRRAGAAGGRLADGVTLVNGLSDIVAIATEPKMDASLPWLDPANKDDQILAAVIEVMRMRPRSPVLLVTRDINLQNKAEFANVQFVEPPDPL